MDVAGGRVGQEVNVQLYDRNETVAQQWKFYDAGNGYVYIKNRLGFSDRLLQIQQRRP